MTRRSLIGGLRAVMTVGYLYGIVRANVAQPAAHFIFDSAACGLYVALWLKGFTPLQKFRIAPLRAWTVVLFVWPVLLFFVPIQNTFVQLVGLRGAVWFLPFLLIGGCLSVSEISGLSVWLALLNLVALGFGGAEYFWDVARFFPHGNVTEIIDASRDVAGNTFRIPSSFVNPASYSSTMNYTLPLLVSTWALSRLTTIVRWGVFGGMAAGCIGVFLGASRSQAIVLLLFAAFVVIVGKVRISRLVILATMGLGVGYVVAQNPRLQRFTGLHNTDYLQRRLELSANSTLVEAAIRYPMGNGLGGGGTSLPYFLRSEVDTPLVIENEYGRIILELGLPGLFMWLGFLGWALVRKPTWPGDEWEFGRQLAWCVALLNAAMAVTGIGMFTAIPGSALLFLLLGWMCSRSSPVRRRILSTTAMSRAGRGLAKGTGIPVPGV
jgi:hypothetical protein